MQMTLNFYGWGRPEGKIQKDLSKLGEWGAKWQMHFKVCECKLIHIRVRKQHIYTNAGMSNIWPVELFG